MVIIVACVFRRMSSRPFNDQSMIVFHKPSGRSESVAHLFNRITRSLVQDALRDKYDRCLPLSMDLSRTFP